MLKPFRRTLILFSFLFGIAMTRCAVAGPITETFDLAAGSVSGSNFSLTLNLADAGVTFDATLSVAGSGTLNQAGTGLGVAGGSNLLNPGEYLGFTMAVSNVIGGTVSFDGFTVVDPNSLTSTNEQGKLSSDNTLANQFQTLTTNSPANISGTPKTFFCPWV